MILNFTKKIEIYWENHFSNTKKGYNTKKGNWFKYYKKEESKMAKHAKIEDVHFPIFNGGNYTS